MWLPVLVQKMFLGIFLSSRPGVAPSKRHAGRASRGFLVVFKLWNIWRIGTLYPALFISTTALCILEQHRILIMFVQYSVNTNIEMSGFLHQLPTNGRNAPVTGQDKRPGAGHRILPRLPRRPNINSFVSSWWTPPLRQHFWPSEQLVNNGTVRSSDIESSSKCSHQMSVSKWYRRQQDDFIIK